VQACNTDAMTDQPTSFNVQWLQDPTAVPSPVNQVWIQGGPAAGQNATTDMFYLTLGHVMPPAVQPGSDQEAIAEAAAAMTLLITPVGRFAITPERLRELRDLLTVTLDQYDGQAQG